MSEIELVYEIKIHNRFLINFYKVIFNKYPVGWIQNIVKPPFVFTEGVAVFFITLYKPLEKK